MKQQKINFYDIPIVDYLLLIGEPIESVSRNYYQHQNHDSLKINSSKNYFVWNSRSSEKNSRGGVVQYLQIVHNLSLKQALDKIEYDLLGKDLNSLETNKKAYPEKFKYRVQEKDVLLETQKYLVTKRKIPNRTVRKFIDLDLISQNNNKEIIFKWKKDNEVVGFSKQGTVKLTEEQKEKYMYKKDYFKYVAPTTEEHAYWGFNYLNGKPKHLYFFESAIDLMSYYSLFEKELEQQKDYWLIAIDGVAIEKVFSFIAYGIEHLGLAETLSSLNVCFDNDKAGIQAFEELSIREIKGINFTHDKPEQEGYDWNDVLMKGRTK